MTSRLEMIEDREDISRYMVHLTRDDRDSFPGGSPARDNFLSILKYREIRAYEVHCLHRRQIPEFHQEKFKVACFTETPLDQIKHLIGPILGRRIALEAYGLVFRREFLIEEGAQAVTYVSTYGTNQSRRAAYDAIFDTALASKFTGLKWKVLPFISAMHDRYDFGWEREWRILGSLSFEPSDVVCAVVPENVDLEIKRTLAALPIPMFSPGWTLERLVEEAGYQQRRVKRLASPKLLPKRAK